MTTDLDLLRDLCAAPAPTGFEAPVQELVRERLSALTEPEHDPLGNVWGTVKGQGAPGVVVTAHADQIGLIVTYVDEHGFVSFDKIGGVDPQLLPGRNLVVHGAKGPVNGVVGRKPSHKMTQGRARQGAGPQRPVARPRLFHTRRGPRPGRDRRPHHVPAELPAAGRRPLCLAGVRQPRRRLRVPAGARALRRGAGAGRPHGAAHRARGDDVHGREGAWPSAGSRT